MCVCCGDPSDDYDDDDDERRRLWRGKNFVVQLMANITMQLNE